MTDQSASDRSFGELMNDPNEEVGDDNVQDSEEVEESSDEEVSSDESTDVEESKEGESEEVETTDEEAKLTEKGTKLDPNPQSAVHQQLANERRVREQYEKVLGDPNLLSEYMKSQFGNQTNSQETDTGEDKAEDLTVKEYKADDFQNLDDVAKVVNNLQKNFVDKTKTYEEKIQQLDNVVKAVTTYNRQKEIANTIEREIESTRSEPEFDSKSPDYIEGLEEKIAQRFHELDFDNTTGTYRGQHSLAKMTKEVLDAVRMGKKAGSKSAQTIVKSKTEGKVKTSSKVDDAVDDNSLSPADSIAKGIAKLGLR